MNGEQYEQVLPSIIKAGDWATYNLLRKEKEGIPERVVRLEELFLEAVNWHDDKASLNFLTWLRQAINDVELISLTVEEGGRLFLPYSNKVKEAKKRAQAARAQKAMELYAKLPTCRTERIGHKDDRYTEKEMDRPTLLETKKAVLAEVAEWWRAAEEEAESDRAFQFLKSVLDSRPLYMKEEERKMQGEVFRAATNQSCPVLRLVRCYLQLVPSGESRGNYEEVARIFAVAIARNTHLGRISLLLEAALPVWNCSKEALGLWTSLASNVAALGRNARELKESMQSQDYEIRSALEKEGYKSIPGDIKIAFPWLGRADVLISVKWYHNWGHFDENKGHEIFEDAKKHVLKWREKHPGVKVRLELTVAREFAYGKEPSFKRERLF